MATSKVGKPIRKITVKTVCGSPDIEQILAHEGKRMDLMDVYGIAKGMRPGSGDNGPYVAFIGDFRAKAITTGEMFVSAKCLLPKLLEEMIAGAGMDGEVFRPVEFAFRIAVVYDKDAAVKYVYDVTPLVPVEENDTIRALESRMTQTLKLVDNSGEAEVKKGGAKK
jgi:hypothetical protein